MLQGTTIHSWNIIGRDKVDAQHHRYWVLECSACGNKRTARTDHINNKLVLACLCQRIKPKKVRLPAQKTHPLWPTWNSMKARCYVKGATGYEYYGARGISMAPEWKDDFYAFAEYMGEKPSPAHTIDRIDNDGDYEPGNVRWATWKQQAANKRPIQTRYAECHTDRKHRAHGLCESCYYTFQYNYRRIKKQWARIDNYLAAVGG